GLRTEIGNRFLEPVRRLLVELGDANEPDVVAFQPRAHGPYADDVARDRYLDGLVLALAHDLKLDLRVHGAAHFLDCLIEGESLHRLVIEMGDDVVGHDSGFGSWSFVDRRHDLDQAFLHCDFDTEAAELAAGLHLHIPEALGIHVARMRIETGKHAV